ncbi:DUF6279 family lipoprotein (plasmid) [Pseudoalteromonas sp. T1lg65]|uniref:DUF6279 family lipoprotein n=1 Tax=Pseudoalteromonas sp. T1lg65 TaxID=2077101 RepID=UPI003F7AA2ED
MKKYFVITILLLLVGCSQRLAYNNLGWLASYYVSDYVELTSAQEEKLQQDVDDLVLWHKETQLPQYQSALTELQANWPDYSAEEIVAKMQTIRGFWYTLIERAYPKIVSHLQDLSAAQRQTLISNITERMNDDRNDDDVLQRYERWLGALTAEQEALITTYNQSGEFSRQVWKAHQQTRMELFERAMSIQSHGELSSLLGNVIVTHHDALPERIKQIQSNRIREFAQLVVSLRATMTNKQIVHFNDELKDIETLLADLLS